MKKDNSPNPQQFHDIVTNGVNLYTRCFEQRSVRSCIYDPEFYLQTKVPLFTLSLIDTGSLVLFDSAVYEGKRRSIFMELGVAIVLQKF